MDRRPFWFGPGGVPNLSSFPRHPPPRFFSCYKCTQEYHGVDHTYSDHINFVAAEIGTPMGSGGGGPQGSVSYGSARLLIAPGFGGGGDGGAGVGTFSTTGVAPGAASAHESVLMDGTPLGSNHGGGFAATGAKPVTTTRLFSYHSNFMALLERKSHHVGAIDGVTKLIADLPGAALQIKDLRRAVVRKLVDINTAVNEGRDVTTYDFDDAMYRGAALLVSQKSVHVSLFRLGFTTVLFISM